MRHAGWPSLAFVFVWINVLALPCSLAIVLDTLSEYTVQGAAYTILPECYVPLLHKLIGIVALCECTTRFTLLVLYTCTGFLIYVNLKSLREVIAPLQIIATVCKVLAMLFIIGVGCYKLIFHEGELVRLISKDNIVEKMVKRISPSPGRIQTIVRIKLCSPFTRVCGRTAAMNVLTTALRRCNNRTGEKNNTNNRSLNSPFRTFPRAQIGGLLFVSVMYMMLNIAYFAVVPSYEMRANDAIAAVALAYIMLSSILSHHSSALFSSSATSASCLPCATVDHGESVG